jgi:hypothetical protein
MTDNSDTSGADEAPRSSDTVPQDDHEWRAGVASTTITPDDSMWLAGFTARDEPADGAETDLHTKAVALTDTDGRTIVLVSVELLSIPAELRENLVRRCREQFGLGPESVAFTATHTHCGPIIQEFRGRMYGIGKDGVERALEYCDRLEDELVDIVGDALDDRQPAALEYGHARCGFAMNRRLPVEDGIAHSLNPDGPVDHDVPVLAIESNETLRAIVFGYACHATTLMTTKYSGDWPGYAMSELEERYPDATALFLTGCAGEQNPAPRRRLELAKQHGQSMANAVQAALVAPGRPVRGPLRLAHEEVSLSFEGYDRADLDALLDSDDVYERRHATMLLERLEETEELPSEYPYPIRAIGFGTDLTMVTMAGEVLVEYGLTLKDELDCNLWVSGFTDDCFTYVPTRDVLVEGGYEGGDVTRLRRYPGRLEPSVEERVLSNARALVDRVRGPTG